MARCMWLLRYVFLLNASLLFASPGHSQSAELTRLADEVVREVISAKGTRLLVAGRFQCEEKNCGGVDRTLAVELGRIISSRAASFSVIAEEKLPELLRGSGLLPIDIYHLLGTRPVATVVKAEVFLSGSLRCRGTHVNLEIQLHKTENGKQLHEVGAEIDVDPSLATGRQDPIHDTASNVYIPEVAGIGDVRCIRCPNPEFTDLAVREFAQGKISFLVTVTAEGRTGAIMPVERLGYGLDEISIRTIRTWQFEAARDKQGNPVAVRTYVEVQFRQY